MQKNNQTGGFPETASKAQGADSTEQTLETVAGSEQEGNPEETAAGEMAGQESGKTVEQPAKSKGKKAFRFLADLICLLCILMLGFYLMPTYVLQRTIVDGWSMENNFHNKENVLVCKFSYRTHKPERFDVITFYPYGRTSDDSFATFIKQRLHLKGVEEDDYYIKRVIGLPGETIQIIGADIYINGEKLEENYGKDPIEETGIAAVPVVLGEDEYFVLGDNRGHSTDSREIGPVKTRNIAGKVVWH